MPEIKKVTVDSIKDFLEQIKEIKKQNYRECLFRGLPDSDWKILSTAQIRLRNNHVPSTVPSSEEKIEEERLEREIGYNESLITDYRHKSFRDNNDSAIAQTDLGLLAQLRHHEAATSLIDFTNDPLVALWFACNEETPSDKDAVVYTLGIKDQNDFVHIYSVEQLQNYSIRIIFDVLYKEYCFYWQPGHLNERIPAQSSYFVIGSKNFQREAEKNSIICIAAEAKVPILSELNNVHNINEFNLFPDISGFSRAHRKNAPIRERERGMSKVRSFNEKIHYIKHKLQDLDQQDPNLQDVMEILHELWESFLNKRGHRTNLESKGKLDGGQDDPTLVPEEEAIPAQQEDVAGEPGSVDTEGRKELSLETERDNKRSELNRLVGKKINFAIETGILEEVVDFINKNKSNDKKLAKCFNTLDALGHIENSLKGYKNAEIIADTILKAEPSQAPFMYFIKSTNNLNLAVTEKDQNEKIDYFKKTIEYIDKTDHSYIENSRETNKDLRKGIIYAAIQECLTALGKKGDEYIKKEIDCYKKVLKEYPNDFSTMQLLGNAILKEIKSVKNTSEELKGTKLIKRYREAIKQFSAAINIVPQNLQFRLDRGHAIWQLVNGGANITREERDEALEDLRLFERNHIGSNQMLSDRDRKFKEAIRNIIESIESLNLK